MRIIGSQTRSTIEEEGLSLHQWLNNADVILSDDHGNFAMYTKNDNYAGHVVEIDGIGYEFVSSLVDGDGNRRNW
jgi:hypothetical protein